MSSPSPPVKDDGGEAPPPPPPTPPPPPPTSSPPPASIPSTARAVSPHQENETKEQDAESTPASKLILHQPLDAPDELDRKWSFHYQNMLKSVHEKDEQTAIQMLQTQHQSPPDAQTFQPESALLYALLTDASSSKRHLKYLTSVASMDGYKLSMGYLQKLIDQKFSKLQTTCRSQLLWLVRELVHANAPNIDKALMSLLRHLTPGDATRSSVWLASSIVRILSEHESWLLASSNFIPFAFHALARIAPDHTGQQHASLLKQETDLCSVMWNRRQREVAQLGREAVRIMNDAKDVQGMNVLWKQLRNVKDAEADADSPFYSVAQLMAIVTPPKYLAYRLTPKMEEHLVFMMERVQLSHVTRYQKWFSSHFLTSPGSDALVPDLVRYICAVYHPSNQILSSKVTPRYHMLGWLYLHCKSPNVLARVQLSMFFDFLYFKPSDSIMNVEPAMLLMVKSVKSHPTMTLAMVQFLVFAVEKFAASPTNKQIMQKGVSSVFSQTLKLGVVQSVQSLQCFPALETSAPNLKSDLHRIFPEHFPHPDAIQKNVSASSSPHPPSVDPSSPVAEGSPVTSSPLGAGSPLSSPVRAQSPTHSDSSAASVGTSTDSNALSSSSFLPTNQEAQQTGVTDTNLEGRITDTALSEASQLPEIPGSLLALGGDDLKKFQEQLPDPTSHPSESFVECLNDLLISWSRMDNAGELATDLGTFLMASLENVVVSAKIDMNASPTDSCPGLFSSMLEHVVGESPNTYVPLLLAMHAHDATTSFRLLAYCCATAKTKTFENALAPYTTFVEALGSSLDSALVKDLAVTQQMDDARALSCAFLDKPSVEASETSNVVDATDAAVLYVAPWLLQNLHSSALTKLSSRRDEVVRLMVTLGSPATLTGLCRRLMLREFEVFGDKLAQTLQTSLSWTSWEQFGVWDLVDAEIASADATTANKRFMSAARKLLSSHKPEDHPEAMNGLLRGLVRVAPDASVLQTIFNLSLDRFGDFPLAVLGQWTASSTDVVKKYVLVILETADDAKREVDEILHKLDRLQAKVDVSGEASSLPLLEDDAIASTLQKLVSDPSTGDTSFPALSARLYPSSEPPIKKQRL